MVRVREQPGPLAGRLRRARLRSVEGARSANGTISRPRWTRPCGGNGRISCCSVCSTSSFSPRLMFHSLDTTCANARADGGRRIHVWRQHDRSATHPEGRRPVETLRGRRSGPRPPEPGGPGGRDLLPARGQRGGQDDDDQPLPGLHPADRRAPASSTASTSPRTRSRPRSTCPSSPRTSCSTATSRPARTSISSPSSAARRP